MKSLKIIFTIILFSALAVNSYAVDVNYLLKKGNENYQDKQYEAAVENYEEIIKSGYEGLSVYYNLGNAYYRLGNLGRAILNYERALKLEPNDEDVQHNLAVANAAISDRIDPLPKIFIFEWLDAILNMFSISTWTFIAYVFYMLTLVLASLYLFSRVQSLQRLSFFSAIGTGLILIFTIFILFTKTNRDLSENYGVVTASAVTVKTSPDSQSADAFIIHEGLKIKIEDEISGWVKIKLADGKLGWAPKGNLAVI